MSGLIVEILFVQYKEYFFVFESNDRSGGIRSRIREYVLVATVTVVMNQRQEFLAGPSEDYIDAAVIRRAGSILQTEERVQEGEDRSVDPDVSGESKGKSTAALDHGGGRGNRRKNLAVVFV